MSIIRFQRRCENFTFARANASNVVFSLQQRASADGIDGVGVGGRLKGIVSVFVSLNVLT